MKFMEQTAPQLGDLDREQTVVIVPIAAVEQHGPHLPTGTDTIICTALAEAVEQALPENTLLLPTFWLGASAHHLRFGGTLDAPLDHYIAILQDICRSLLNEGFQRILLLNGHGGNIDPLKIALRGLQTDYPDALLAGGAYWETSADLLQKTLDGDHKFVGHACEFETSMIMHLRPELVVESELADAGQLIPDRLHGFYVARDLYQRTRQGCTGRPDLATAEKGAELFAGIVERLTAAINTMLQQPLATDYESFLG